MRTINWDKDGNKADLGWDGPILTPSCLFIAFFIYAPFKNLMVMRQGDHIPTFTH